jgi:hypothetical protein
MELSIEFQKEKLNIENSYPKIILNYFIKRTILHGFIGILLYTAVYGQTKTAEFPSVSIFVPMDYSVLNLTVGNLNSDSIEDIILILKKNGEDSLSSAETPMKRKVLLLLGQQNKSYKLAAQNENAVNFLGADGNFRESFEDVRIENGSFSIDHYGGFTYRWGRSITFKYNSLKNNWYLSKDEYTTFNVTDLAEKGTEKLLNTKDYGTLIFEKFDIYKE